MPIAPVFTSPCDLASRLPAMIAEFLDIEQHLKRRFREDSITDILIASLLSLPGNDVVVQTPSEAKTGGDFDLVIVDPGSEDAIQFRVQAKRLTPHANDWTTGSYVELSHPHNSGVQSRLLVSGIGRESIPTIPLYAFYNPAHVCVASGETVTGIELASGWEIRERVKAMVKIKPKRLPYKRIGSLQPLFFPLSTILCPPRPVGGPVIPLPTEARNAVEAAIETRSSLAGFGQTLRISAPPEVPVLAGPDSGGRRRSDAVPRDLRARQIPAIIRTAIERRRERIVPARVKRPRVVLIAEGNSAET
ncbi:MAG: hypothetical protein EOP62_10940 [Sphingomonadales bacterium]|nr:MAG: hypothetical protein EOP62_10940 [Sphingomonadales bacterium]